MSLSPETLELCARGLGYDRGWSAQSSRAGSYVFSWRSASPHKDLQMTDYLSVPDVAAACKAKLRESWLNCEAWHGPNAASARIYQPMGYGKLDTFAFHEVCGPESSDDECVILAFAHVVAKGALP
jgi:hypothetical protein